MGYSRSTRGSLLPPFSIPLIIPKRFVLEVVRLVRLHIGARR